MSYTGLWPVLNVDFLSEDEIDNNKEDNSKDYTDKDNLKEEEKKTDNYQKVIQTKFGSCEYFLFSFLQVSAHFESLRCLSNVNCVSVLY